MSFEPSRTAIDNAGVVLRDWWLGPDPELEREVSEAFHLVWDFRRTFRSPLQKVTVGIQQFVKRESSAVLVGQRLMRVPTIIDKLVRLQKMKVTRMEDIGGCRAILPGGKPEIEGVLRRSSASVTTSPIRSRRDTAPSTSLSSVTSGPSRSNCELPTNTGGRPTSSVRAR